jgi:hypothetical protein
MLQIVWLLNPACAHKTPGGSSREHSALKTSA